MGTEAYDADNPEKFLKQLEARIENNSIKKYIPPCIVDDFFLQDSPWYCFIDKIKEEYDNTYFSNDHTKNISRYIHNVPKNIHYEILSQENGMFLCLNFESPAYCSAENIALVKNMVENEMVYGEYVTGNKLSIIQPCTIESFAHSFSLLYHKTINDLIMKILK